MKKKLLSLLIAGVLLWGSVLPAAAAPSGISARSAVVIDAENGRILYEKDARTPGGIASTTKIMTALVVLERCNPDSLVYIRPEYTGIEGSSMYLKAGERLTVRELLYGMLLVSGNDAATALACYTAGTVERFAALMNMKAAELGLTTAHFCNPHGLDAPGHSASALDMARIAAAAMDHALFAKIVASKTAAAGGRTLVNHNKLLWMYAGACGVKTGYTKSTGRSLVSCCERAGARLICVTLGAPDDWNDHMQMYDAVWSSCSRRCAVSAGDILVRLPVIGGMADFLPVRAVGDVPVLAADGDEIEVRLYLPHFVYADVQAGEVIGSARVSIDGVFCGETQLAAAQSVCQDGTQRAGFREKLRLHIRLLFKR